MKASPLKLGIRIGRSSKGSGKVGVASVGIVLICSDTVIHDSSRVDFSPDDGTNDDPVDLYSVDRRTGPDVTSSGEGEVGNDPLQRSSLSLTTFFCSLQDALWRQSDDG